LAKFVSQPQQDTFLCCLLLEHEVQGMHL
jgi:hypothetical protein